ncbi:MAG: mevalonate kinase [Candidatus Thorarchaeota archaeon]
MDKESISYSAPGKIILFGEHAVVYGYAAIAIAIELRAKCTIVPSLSKKLSIITPDLFPNKRFTINKESSLPSSLKAIEFLTRKIIPKEERVHYPVIEITSEIPPSAGLGSSAAVAVSLISSLYAFLNKNNNNLNVINKMAFEAEKIIHGSPSGIDNTISTFGGGIFYEKGVKRKIQIDNKTCFFVIVNSLIPRNTKDVVEKVKQRRADNKQEIDQIFEDIQVISYQGEMSLKKGDHEKTGILMSENHLLLEKLGVGHPELTKIIRLVDKHGALGRKLTGAGQGGCIVALFDDFQKAQQAINTLKEKGFQAFLTNVSLDGVRNESEHG